MWLHNHLFIYKPLIYESNSFTPYSFTLNSLMPYSFMKANNTNNLYEK